MGDPEQLELGIEGAGSIGLPAYAEPMRVRPVSLPFDSPDYLFETRWHGIRAIAGISRGQVRLHNRRQGDVTRRFPELARLTEAAANQPMMLDGEIIVVDERGHPDFESPQWRLRLLDDQLIESEALRHPACFLATDILFLDQRWLLSEPLHRRKRLLSDVLQQADCLYLAEQFETEGVALFQAAVDSELEGIVAKPRDSLYAPGAFGGWLAVGRQRHELVVGGYSMHFAGRARVVELLLGSYDSAGALTFITTVQPPSDEHLRNELFSVLNALQVEQPPFDPTPPFIACWVRPELVVTVRFGELPGEAAFERVRLDMAPEDCLLPGDAPPAAFTPERERRPQLTMLTTLPLPLDSSSEDSTAPRPSLRLLDDAS